MNRADLMDAQRRAADPARSAFVTANAGSGKTKTLIDRVARLLLGEVDPEKILCVTYTKAAAAEMQRRLFDRLGGWSVRDDDSLREELAELLGRTRDDFDPKALSDARSLFAKALETPGGLKIQTIHAFCEKLLRRFPVEAGVSPGFRVMDDPTAAAVAVAARRAVAQLALAQRNLAVADAYARLSVALDFESFQSMFVGFEARRGALSAFFTRCGGFEGAEAWLWSICNAPPGADLAKLDAAAAADLNRDLWRRAAEALSGGAATDQKNAERLRATANDPQAGLAAQLSCLFTEKGAGTAATWVAKSKSMQSRPELQSAMLAEQDRLAAARDVMRGARIALETRDALVLAHAYLSAYEIEKASAGALDFTDLIEKAGALVDSSPAAAWVLYKLDGGIDHILVDEAQDTAPDQWKIVRALSDEFFAGAGTPRARGRNAPERTVFVVGDEKQSIYSFQGADPARLRLETNRMIARIEGAGRLGGTEPLLTSWRSTPQVLTFVDAVFPVGVPPGDGPLRHEPMRDQHDGCVDLWDLFRDSGGEERGAWDAPLDTERADSANRRLAQAIAGEIADTLGRGDAVFDKDDKVWRPSEARDVLILVRKRGGLFDEILRALKAAGLPVGGADRLALSGHIAFDDLMALARFVLFPGDDLNLAALLRSPFFDVEDDQLYDLAHGREMSLWARLTAQAAVEPQWVAAHGFLCAACAVSRERAPLEFFRWALGFRDAAGRSMRARILRRLGLAADDTLDEFLAQVLAAEGRGIADLETLAADFASLDITVKREMEAGRNEVRVMTAHGAKGLEAPIVFLPIGAGETSPRGSPLLETEDGGFLWSPRKDEDCPASAEARARRVRKEDEEAQRLLYVALTRARDRLVICGRIAANRKEDNLAGWWPAVRSAFDALPQSTLTGEGRRRFGPDPQRLAATLKAPYASGPLPAWIAENARSEAFARYASPSNLGESEAALATSPLAEQGGLGRFRRGDLIHRLLQILPDLPPDERKAAALAILGRERDLTDAQRQEMAAAAFGVLQDARFAQVFGPGGRAEVAVAGTAAALPAGLTISGRIDRLVVLEDRVLVADFKTNRPSPDRIEDADPVYIRQMAIYTAVLSEVFPGRTVEAALVWTDGPKLMAVPENMMAQTLIELRHSG